MGKAPSGILKVFLVLPEGEKNFIRSPVGDLKSFILPEGEKNFIRSPVGDLKSFIVRWCGRPEKKPGPSEKKKFFCLLEKIAVLEPLGQKSF